VRKLALSVAAALVAAGSARVASAVTAPPPTPVEVPCTPPGASPTPSSSPTPSPSAPPTPEPGPSNGLCVSPSPFPSVLHTPPPSSKPPHKPPRIRAKAAILEDLDTGEILFARRPDVPRALASTTKIMTALLTMSLASPGQVVQVGPEAAREATAGPSFSELGLELGERISVEQLLYALMLQSSNDAAVALAEALSGTEERFVQTMNRKARGLRLRHTKFFSPSGVDDRGHSTARALATITRLAFRSPLFDQIVATKFHTIPAPSGEARHVQNRNALLWLYPGAIGVKTGYTSAAGFCLVAAADRHGRRLVSVVMGDPSGDASFDDAASLLNYGYRGFKRVKLARRGHALAPVPVGTRALPVVAGGDLSPLVPAAGVRNVSPRVRVRPGLELPLPAGTNVGSVRFVVKGRTLGAVSMVVASAAAPGPSPSPAPSGAPAGSPWWSRGAVAVARFTLHAFWSLFG